MNELPVMDPCVYAQISGIATGKKHCNSQGSDYWQLIQSVLSTEKEIRSDEGLSFETSALKLFPVAS